MAVPGGNGQSSSAAVKDVRHDIVGETFADFIIKFSGVMESVIACKAKDTDWNIQSFETVNDTAVSSELKSNNEHANAVHTDEINMVSRAPENKLKLSCSLDVCYYSSNVQAVNNDGHHILYDEDNPEALN